MSLSRRAFLGTSALGLLAGGLGTGGLSALTRRVAPALEFTPLRRDVGIFTSRGGTIGWLIRPEGAVVVDTQFPDTARACLEGVRERTGGALAAVINTHHHGDHTAGNPVFEGVAERIVAYRRVPELQRRSARESGSEEDQAYADTTFDETWSLEVGDETIRARHYRPAHTGGDATIFFERANVVHMGDLVFNRFYPFIDRPGGASVRGWIRLLEAVADEHDGETLFIFGHGRPEFGVTGGRDDILYQRDFFSALLETAEQAVARGASREEATRVEVLRGFPDHRPPAERLNLAAALGVAYDEVRAEG